MIAYKFAQTGQIVILEKNLRKRVSGINSVNDNIKNEVEKVNTHNLKKQLSSLSSLDSKEDSSSTLSAKSTNPSTDGDNKSDLDI